MNTTEADRGSDPGEGQTVLVAHADAAYRALLEDMLAADALRVEWASCGEKALARLQAAPIDLLITGTILPRVDGLELLKAVRARAPDLPVLVLSDGSGDVYSVYLRCARLLGATETFESPINFRAVRAGVRRALRPNRQEPKAD